MASDSRISIGPGVWLDSAVKIVKVPLTCYGENASGKQIREPIYSASVGVALIGSTVTCYPLLQNITSILGDLQVVSGVKAVSFHNHIPIIKHWYQNAGRVSCKALGSAGRAELIVCGTEQTSAAMRAFHFRFETTDYPIRAAVEELDLTKGPLFFGSGRSAALDYLDQHPRATPFHLLRGIIGDGKVPTVGGHIQYGSLRNYGFVVYGILDYGINREAWQFTTGAFKAGLPLETPVDLYEVPAIQRRLVGHRLSAKVGARDKTLHETTVPKYLSCL